MRLLERDFRTGCTNIGWIRRQLPKPWNSRIFVGAGALLIITIFAFTQMSDSGARQSQANTALPLHEPPPVENIEKPIADAPLVSAPEIKEKKEPKPSGTEKQLYTSVELVRSFLRRLPSDASPGDSGWNQWSLDKANAWLETNVVGKRWSMRIKSINGDFQRISGQGLTYEGMCSIEPGRVNVGGRPFDIMISPGFMYGNILPIETSETEFVDAFRDGGKIVREEYGGVPIVLAATIQGVEISQQGRSGSSSRGEIVIAISEIVVSLPKRLDAMTSEAAEHAKYELQKIKEGITPVYPHFSDSIADGIELCGIKMTRERFNSVTPGLPGIWAVFHDGKGRPYQIGGSYDVWATLQNIDEQESLRLWGRKFWPPAGDGAILYVKEWNDACQLLIDRVKRINKLE